MKTYPILRPLYQRTGDSHYRWTKKWGAGHFLEGHLRRPKQLNLATPIVVYGATLSAKNQEWILASHRPSSRSLSTSAGRSSVSIFRPYECKNSRGRYRVRTHPRNHVEWPYERNRIATRRTTGPRETNEGERLSHEKRLYSKETGYWDSAPKGPNRSAQGIALGSRSPTDLEP